MVVGKTKISFLGVGIAFREIWESIKIIFCDILYVECYFVVFSKYWFYCLWIKKYFMF